MNSKLLKHLLINLLIFFAFLQADYPDQQKVIRAGQMWNQMSSVSNIILSDDGKTLQLTTGSNSGNFILSPDTLDQPFDRGLPSWNGRVFHENSGFKVLMRFKQGSTWSPWLTVGYWKNYIWSTYGATSYPGGYIDYDYVVLDDFHFVYQWSVQMKRGSDEDLSPTIDKLSFFVSDERTTKDINYSAILSEKPAEIFYPTSFISQYNVNTDIGGNICSPTSTVFAIRSYDITVDPYSFAVDNYDTYWGLYGIWPRAIQNASKFNLDGAVTRYRNWGQARDTLAAGGRVVMSVGPPLYAGHLMMLAGFDARGDPVVHDPAKQNGDTYKYNKSDLSHSWFDKGGVAYTFFQEQLFPLTLNEDLDVEQPDQLVIYQNYPNPFNHGTVLRFFLAEPSAIKLSVYDLTGRLEVAVFEGSLSAGEHRSSLSAGSLPAGVYLLLLESNTGTSVRRITLLK